MKNLLRKIRLSLGLKRLRNLRLCIKISRKILSVKSMLSTSSLGSLKCDMKSSAKKTKGSNSKLIPG